MKPTSTNVFIQVAKSMEVTWRNIWTVWRMLKCFPATSLTLITHLIGSMGTGVIMQKDDSVRQYTRAFWLYGASQHPQPPRNEPHLSALSCLPPFPMLDEHILHHAHLQSNKETTVLPAFARNVVYGGCSVFTCLPLRHEFCLETQVNDAILTSVLRAK